MRSGTVTFPLATVGAVLAVVACGPRTDHASITADKPSAFSLAMGSCKDSLSTSRAVGFSKEKPTTVNICLVSQGTNGKKTLAIGPSVVSYKISKGDMTTPAPVAATPKATPAPTATLADAQNIDDSDETQGPPATKQAAIAATISMKIALTIPQEMSDDEKSMLNARLWEACVIPEQQMFLRSPLQSFGVIAFNPRFIFPKIDELGTQTTTSQDQTLALNKIVDGSDTSYSLNGSQPDVRFYPSGKSADVSACKAALAKAQKEGRGLSAPEEAICVTARASRQKANQPFCAALTHMTSAWLGLVDAQQENEKCGVKTAVTTSAPAPTPATSSTFVKPSSNSSDDYLSKAILNQSDLLTILSPACSNVVGLKN